MKKQILILALLLVLSVLFLVGCQDPDETTKTGETTAGITTKPSDTPIPKEGDFNLFASDFVYILSEGEADPDATEGEWPGVVRAAGDLRDDIETVTDLSATVVKTREELGKGAVIITGSLERSPTVKALADAGKIDTTDISGKWESYRLEVVADPFEDGSVEVALVIFGSDKRGAIFGIYELSELLGVSPLKYFADSVADEKSAFVLSSDYQFVSGEPSVKYRGIFLNDEEQLTYWARKLDGDLNMGPNVYLKIYEMLLRMKANYLWPAMHVCVEAFNAFPENPKNADYYGIVIGTSHCDMLLRNNLNEWDQFKADYRAETGYTGTISYDYTVCPEIVTEYWRRSVQVNKDYEVQWTLGMRGAHDEGFTAVNLNKAPWYGDSTKLLEEIIEVQRDILREELNNPTLENVFQVFIPYKEVQAIYNQGLTLPDDVMIMWADDNHGFIRNLPNEEERERSGGHGIYYHNSYWGPEDESYMWLNTMPLTLFYEEMSKAIRYGADRAWIINVGDIKPGELSMEFLLDYAHHAERYDDENVYTFVKEWAKREFPEADADMIVSIEKRLCQYTNARKLEHMKVDLFTNVYFNDEFEKRLSEYTALLKDAEAVYASLKESHQATFYETVLYQVRSAYYSNAEFFYATKSNFALAMGKSVTAYNCSRMAVWFNELKKYETEYFNKVLLGGKWNGILTPEEHDPPVSPGYAQSSPAIELVKLDGGVIVEGEFTESEKPTLSFDSYTGGRKFIDIFSKGVEAFSFTVTECPDFVTLTKTSGTVYDEVRIFASVDFSRLQKSSEGDIVITYANGKRKTVHIVANVYSFVLSEKTYVEGDGYVSMEAEHYTAAHKTDSAYFTTIKDLGRVSGDMVKVISTTLSGVSPDKVLTDAPYLEYKMHLVSSGEFEAEIFRLPTLNVKGKVRFAVQFDGGKVTVIEGESDYGTDNPAWEEGVFTQIIRHKFTVTADKAGEHTLRIYMIDPELCFDKIVVYTDGYKDSYFGPYESYNTTYNEKPDNSYTPVYETKFLPKLSETLTDSFGTGYFVEEKGEIRIEAATAFEGSDYAYTENNDLGGGFLLAVSPGRLAMRTTERDASYAGKRAPTMNFVIYVEKGGTYTLSAEVLAPTPSSDSFIVAIDGSDRLTKNDMFDYNRDEIFVWHSCGSITLTAGVHTLTVKAREDGLIISKLVLAAGSYSSESSAFTATVRTPVINAGMKDDVAARRLITSRLDRVKALDGAPIGDGIGCYTKASYEALLSAREELLSLIRGTTPMTEAGIKGQLDAFDRAYTAFIASRKMESGGKEYLVWDDFSANASGTRPFGVEVFDEKGEPDGNVYREGDEAFLALRAFKLQSKIEALSMGYTLKEPVTSGTFVLEAKLRFNEGKWADLFRVKNESGEDSVVVAIERISSTESAIVAYSASSKKVLATYETGKWITVRVEIDLARSAYHVYVDGERVNTTTLRFRNDAESLTAFTFGVKYENTDLNISSVKAYVEK